MKYNININQLAMSDLSKDLDIFDASILDYLVGMCTSISDKIQGKRLKDDNNNSWTWIDLQKLMEDMPLLRINSKGAITRRIKKIEGNGFITTQGKSVDGHIRLFVKLETKTDKLTFSKNNVTPPSTLIMENDNVDNGERGSEKHVDESEPIIILDITNTEHNTRPLERGAEKNLSDLFEVFWKEYPVKVGKKPSREKWLRKVTPELAERIIENVRKRKTSDRNWLRGFIVHPTTYLNQERWDDEIQLEHAPAPNLALGTPYVKGKYENKGETVLN